ncbi:hypothetical protein OROHE_000120 [Orobanche hederae]
MFKKMEDDAEEVSEDENGRIHSGRIKAFKLAFKKIVKAYLLYELWKFRGSNGIIDLPYSNTFYFDSNDMVDSGGGSSLEPSGTRSRHVQKAESVYLKKEQELKKETRKYKVGVSLGKSLRNSGCQWKFVRKTEYEKLWLLLAKPLFLVVVSRTLIETCLKQAPLI